jgi:hypothetical protein
MTQAEMDFWLMMVGLIGFYAIIGMILWKILNDK